MKTWHDNVNNYITSTQVTQKEMAKKFGISESSISRKLRCERRWTVEDVMKIAKYYGITVDELIRGEE